MSYFEGLDFDQAFKSLQPPAPKDPGVLRSAGDTALSVGRGVVQGTKMVSDAFGAGNPVSNTMQKGIDWLSSNFSDYSQWEQLTSAQDQQAAALSGSTWEEVKAAARSFSKRPVDFLAEAAGTSLPTIAAAFLPGGQGALLGRVAMMGMGAAQGAGAVKGQIFQTVEEAWRQAGSAPEEARERATAAQDYFGSNAGQVALGAALGALAGGTGVEAGVLGARAGAGRVASEAAAAAPMGIMARAAARTPQFLKDGLKEALPEAAQGGQEQLAANLAMQNEGFATPTMQGVAGNATLEALAGGAFGAAVSPLTRAPRADQGLRELGAATNGDELIAAFTKATDVPLTGISADQESAAMGIMERQAKADQDQIKLTGRLMPMDQQRRPDAAPAAAEDAQATVTDSPYLDRLLTLQEQVADPAVREQVRKAFGPDALREVLRAMSVADRPDINMPEVTRDRVLAAAETIVSRAIAQPLPGAAPSPSARRVSAGPELAAPAPVPRIGLDTTQTGTIRVDGTGSAAPETRADAISTKQRVDEMRKRPDGMTQQVPGRPLPRDFELVGEGTLTTPERPARAAPLAIALDTALDERAHAAATSPTNDRPEPTQAQKEAGNYAKGHVRISGLDISIENPAGSTRKGVDSDGKAWENQVQHHYGYIRRTVGADGDHVDAFVKPGTAPDHSGPVFIVDQVDPKTGKFDEHKVVLGAVDRADAEAVYRANYAPDWQGMKSIKGMTMPAFKKWLAGDTTKPIGTLKDRVDAMRTPDAQKMPEGFYSEAMPDGRVRLRSAKNTNGLGAYATEADAIAEANAIVKMRAERGLPTDKLAQLVERTGRSREDVAKQYTGFVEKHGREKADELLDKALQVAEANPKPAPAPAPNEEAPAQPAVADQPSQPEPAASSPAPAAEPAAPAAPEAAATEQAAEPAPAPAAPPPESAADNGSPDEVATDKSGARALDKSARPAELIALRKRESILKSIKECLYG